jgi:hypothetical protein
MKKHRGTERHEETRETDIQTEKKENKTEGEGESKEKDMLETR